MFFLYNTYYGCDFLVENSLFNSSAAQFGGVGYVQIETFFPSSFRIRNSTLLLNKASKDQTIIGIDYSQGGCFIAISTENSQFFYENVIFTKTFARKSLN